MAEGGQLVSVERRADGVAILLYDARTFETPNAVMRTYASPEVNGAEQAVWRTEMAPGAAGPVHATDAEEVIVVLAGRLRATVEGEERTLEAGDAIVLPANVSRQLGNPFDEPVATISTSRPGAGHRGNRCPGRDPLGPLNP